MIPGEYKLAKQAIEINKGRNTKKINVANLGDRPIQVGSHFHFLEVNRELQFDREATIGFRLNVAAGTAVRFEPGEEKEVELVEIAGNRKVYGLNNLTNGDVSDHQSIAKKLKQGGF
ncbi:urease beta subunit [Gracilibacillus boraciitolerans JCM 21714]|uniref:Urease subunit beta n=1 Tax=Gracilibacillus boraciitolerans JCM 21714 TaxID=1298598 RepID=W4VKI0_9BACI|nr:urease subunit beta [Gracilibacillus boraciitolerans]GAE93328.1 urease beta subunit [Gracilibacillus boraciitolerans JCM 21714]